MKRTRGGLTRFIVFIYLFIMISWIASSHSNEVESSSSVTRYAKGIPHPFLSVSGYVAATKSIHHHNKWKSPTVKVDSYPNEQEEAKLVKRMFLSVTEHQQQQTKHSPRKSLLSFLQFLFTLIMYILGVGAYSRINVDNYCNALTYGKLKICEMLKGVIQPEPWKIDKITLRLKELLRFNFFNRIKSGLWGENPEQSINVYPASEIERVSTFKILTSKAQSPVSVLLLSQSGFYYTHQEDIVECFGCHKRLQLKDFTSDPGDNQFHSSPNCQFVKRYASPTSQSHATGDFLSTDGAAAENGFGGSGLTSHGREEEEEAARIDGAIIGQLPTEVNTESAASAGVTTDRSNNVYDTTTTDNRGSPTSKTNANTISPPEGGINCADLCNFGFGGREDDGFTQCPNDEEKLRRFDHITCDSHTLSPDSLPCSVNSSSTENTTAHAATASVGAASSKGTESQVAYPKPDCTTCEQVPALTTSGGEGARPKIPKIPSTSGVSEVKAISAGENQGSLTYWNDEKNFTPEGFFSLKGNPGSRRKLLHWKESCEKNDYHESFYQTSVLEMDQIPEAMQSQELFETISHASHLVARLEVTKTSPSRPKNDSYLEESKQHQKVFCRSGTGFVDPYIENDKAEEIIKKLQLDVSKSKVKKMKQFVSNSIWATKGKVYYFSLKTTRHVIFDDLEASNTEVIFETSNYKDGVIKKYNAKGVHVIHSDVEGIYSSILICKTYEDELVYTLKEEKQKLASLIQGLSSSTKRTLVGRCFVISHPHGQQKMVTFGECTFLKYVLQSQDQADDNRQLIRHSNCKEGTFTQADILETLMYTAGTCSGSSGAAVFTCRAIRPSPEEDMQTKLSVLIHNGVEKDAGLSCSIMDNYRPDLTDKPPPKKPMATSQSASSASGNNSGSSSATNSADSQSSNAHATQKPSPDLKEVHRYFNMKSRLESFTKSSFKSLCKHTPTELAAEGFYYTGIEDCVKCFCCNLGLKGWKEDNDVHTEHKDHRPDCKYRKAHEDIPSEIDPGLLYIDNADDEDSSIMTGLLKSERQKLKDGLMCKVCWKHPVSECFLACGHVISCDKCAQFLNICPLCNREIQATVSVYMC